MHYHAATLAQHMDVVKYLALVALHMLARPEIRHKIEPPMILPRNRLAQIKLHCPIATIQIE